MTAQSNAANALAIARKLAALGGVEEACRAYAIAAVDENEVQSLDRLESALYLLQNGGDYKISYTVFIDLFTKGHFQNEILSIMLGAFYEPNVKQLKKRYEKNCKRLAKYPYLFRKDFPAFEDLPVIFFPYDDNGYVPYYINESRFGEFVNFNNPVISHYFFKDLEKPVLGTDVYSFYELEYLNDNVRRSDWVARENHIYLHYTDWGAFCAHLACWNLGKILDDEKFVFLIGDEIARYPIDFKAEFGIDYSQYPVRPYHVSEITRLIWHTQLSSHNGGDFFNEVFHGHPNLLGLDSVLFDPFEDGLQRVLDDISRVRHGSAPTALPRYVSGEKELWLMSDTREYQELLHMNRVTKKDVWVAFLLNNAKNLGYEIDPASRIVPTIFFQPHFSAIVYSIDAYENNFAKLESKEYEKVIHSPFFREFKYIKTFTPLRRFTTGYGGSVKYVFNYENADIAKLRKEGKNIGLLEVSDILQDRVLNRSFMTDGQERLFKDSVLVRFEDGKLNPKATFTALAEFLDIPYTESMTCCSNYLGIDPETTKGNARGFDPSSVYKKYDEFATDEERAYLEYMLRDAYEYYGYDFHYYDGKPMTSERLEKLLEGFTIVNRYKTGLYNIDGTETPEYAALSEELREAHRNRAESMIAEANDNRRKAVEILGRDLKFVNKNGQPLRMMPLLKLDPELLETELYH